MTFRPFAISTFLVVSALLVAPAVAQSGLMLKIDPVKERFALGEPVYLTLEIQNTTDSSVDGFFDLDLGSFMATIEVSFEGEPYQGFAPMAVDDKEMSRRSLASGERIGLVQPIFFGARGWTFERPGNYTIRASYKFVGSNDRIVSPTVSINVYDDPVGRPLVSAEDLEPGKFMAWLGGDHLQSGRRMVESAADATVDSPVTHYARWILGESLARPFRNYVEGRVRPADPRASLAYLDRVNTSELVPFARMMLSVTRARCYAALGAKGEIEAELSDAEALVASYPALEQQYRELLDDLREGDTSGVLPKMR